MSPSMSPTPKATAGALPPLPVLRNYCKQYQRGKIEAGSRRWHVLVLAAGGADRIPAYCDRLLPDED
jgi:hypothetical protein